MTISVATHQVNDIVKNWDNNTKRVGRIYQFRVYGQIKNYSTNFTYRACADPSAHFAGVKGSDIEKRWKCDKNGKMYDDFVYRYYISFVIKDKRPKDDRAAHCLKVTAFHQCAKQILSPTVAPSKNTNQTIDKQLFESRLESLMKHPSLYTISAQYGMYNGETTVRYVCQFVKCISLANKAYLD